MDAFASLKIPRAPLVDASLVADAFQRLAAIAHPDSPGGSTAEFATLNDAWRTLREPASCLRHFLELEHPGALATNPQPPADLGDMFMEIADFRRALDDFRARESAASSPIARAVLAPVRAKLTASLASLRARVDAMRDAILGDIPAVGPERLVALHTRLVFLGKWAAQLREAAVE